ncbi:MAG: hypothetical protein IK142_02575 [Clostridiales bacterium]|nr:hypothetical protein [Clostridiales bacterium]
MSAGEVGSVSMLLKLEADKFRKDLKAAANQAASEAKSASKSASGAINGVSSSVKGLTSVVKKLAGAFGIALSVAALISFGKACVDLGSDLAEVQNVVQVTFGDMEDEVNEFARSAIKNFGISETAAKNYMGTLGAMSQAFGFTQAEAYEQAEALTALAGDMASFYNKTTDETYNALRAVYSGETEALKQYGIVMTESALNEFALARGMGKTVSQMSEKEKVSLRLMFVEEKMNRVSGDFINTENSWANQTKVLSLQWDSFKATIGQGLINVLTPIVQWLNAIMEAAQGAAQAFADFTATIMGISPDLGGVADTTAAAAQSAQDINDGISSAGGAAKKAVKQLAGFDKLNILSKQSSGGGGGGSKNPSVSPASIDKATLAENGLNESLSRTRELINEITGSFRQGFAEGFAGFDYGPTLENIRNIRDSVLGIANDPNVRSAGERFMTNLAEGMGKVTGSIARIGGVTAQTLTGGVERFLQSHDSQIRNYIIDMFDIEGDIAQITGDLSVSAANIFEGAFGTPVAESLVSDLINIPAQIKMTTTQIGAQLARDILAGFYTIVSENEGGLTSVLSGLVSFAASVVGTISTAVTDMGNTVRSVYDEYISPFISGMSEALSELLGVIIEFWEGNVQPILDMIGEKAQELWEGHFKSLFENLMGFIGRLMSLIQALWVNYLQPVVAWIIKNILPVIMPIIKTIIAVVMEVAGIIGSAISGIIAILNGIIDFITGVLTGDWELAWEGIKEIFVGAWEDGILPILNGLESIFEDVFDGVVEAIKNALNAGLAWVETFVNNVIDGINGIIGAANSASNAVGGPNLVNELGHITLPRLANGGFVEANTPQLAVIGDNRHQGEFVAPEDKLQAAVTSAMMAMMPQMAMAMANAVSRANNGAGGDITIHNHIDLDGDAIYDNQEKVRRRREKRSGGN